MAVLSAANITLLDERGTNLARVADIVLGSRISKLDSDGTYTGTLGEAVVAIGGTGGVAANDIVYVSGSSGTSRVVLKADADAIATMRNLYYAKEAIAEGASGYVYKRGLMTAQNTNAATVGDPVYADTATAGGWTLTKPSGAADIIVEIGIVTVRSTTVGVIDVDIGAGVLEFDIHSLTGLGAAPAIGDFLAISDESTAGDPHRYITIQELFNGIAGATAFTGAIVPATDQVFIDDAGVVKRATFQVLMDGVEDLVATDVTFVPGTDKLLVSDAGVAVNVTYQVLMNGVNDLTALAAAPALTDSVLVDDAGVAKKLTVQYLFDAAFTLAADTVASGDYFMLLEAGGVAKLESINDLATFLAGTGLAANSGVLSVSPTESASADVVPTTDSILILDADDSNIQKQESVQHFLDSVDDLVAFTGAIAPAADKVLFLDAGVAKVATYQVFMNGVANLTALAAAPALTDNVLIDDAGTAKSLTVQYLLDAVASLAADTVADGDYFLLSEAGGVSKLEAIADLATLFAGAGLTATNSVIAVDGVTDAMLSSKMVKRPARKAWGALYMTGISVDEEILTVGARTYGVDIAKNGVAASDVDVEVDNTTADELVTKFAAAINGDGTAICSAVADTTNDILFIYADTAGAAGNALALVEGFTNGTVSAATLVDGADAAVGAVVAFRHTITTTEAAGGAATAIRIDTGLTSIQSVHLSWEDAGVITACVCPVVVSAGILTITEGTAWGNGDILNILVVGTE